LYLFLEFFTALIDIINRSKHTLGPQQISNLKHNLGIKFLIHLFHLPLVIFLLILYKLPYSFKPIFLGQYNFFKAFIDHLLFDSVQGSLIIHTVQFEVAFEMVALFGADLFDQLHESGVVGFGLIGFLQNA
jgi:hypothetical protein